MPRTRLDKPAMDSTDMLPAATISCLNFANEALREKATMSFFCEDANEIEKVA
jgi:hypothetical protein